MDEKLPERVGPYRIERKLGAGGMGTVYYGRHAESGSEAAVKVLPASMAREDGFVARFTREIEALRKVDSPLIVKLYESGVDDETYFYAMEYVHGETLTSRLERERRIPWREVVEIGVQICKALKAAHNAGVIHRDLKPSNLLLAEDGTVKLTDFGVAQVFAGGKLTLTGGVIGTAEYMSPEQAQGQRATKRSDIYSLGAVLYVMLAGRPPFTGKTALEIAQKHRFNQFDSPRRIVPEIPRWLDEIVCACLEKKPEDRYPDAYVLSLRLQEVPKKVDFAKGTGDLTFDLGPVDASAETMAAVDPAAGKAVVGGTLMRDLLRAHIEQARAHSPLQGLLDNTWVLVALLALLLLGGVLWHQSRRPSPERLFARGEELMQNGAWDRARREAFDPLLELDAETWGPLVAPHLDKIAVLELERDVLGPRAKRADRVPQSEPERFIQQALQQRRQGDFGRAEQTLESLLAVLGDDEAHVQWRQLAATLLDAVRSQQPPIAERYELLRASLERADALRAAGKIEDARSIWRGVLGLYDSDPGAAEWVARARGGLEETGMSNDESQMTNQ